MPQRIHHRRRAVLGLIAAAVLVAGGTAAARAMTGGDGNRYRTATATMGSVEQLVTGVGTVAAVNQVSVSFPVSGTVATVPVSVGSKVSAGQTLATLSTTSLNQSLDSANSTLATAQQTLATDQASQTESTATESSVQLGDGESADSTGAIVLTAAVSKAPPSSGGRPTGGSGVSQLIKQITAAQKAVIGAQQKLDQDLTAAESALATCQNALSSSSSPPPTSTPPSSTPTPTDSAPATPTATATGSAAASTPAANDGDETCLAAIAAAPTKTDAAKDQQTRDAAEQTLDAAIQELEKTASSSGNSTGGTGSGGGQGSGTGSGTGSHQGGKTGTGSRSGSGTSGSGSSNRSSTGNSSGQGNRTSTGPASAAQLAADQAQIDAAAAQLVVAKQNLKAATLTSPLAGTVAEVSITAGKNAGSNTITVIGSGQSQVTTTVALADIDKVKVGDPATVKVDGISSDLAGSVSLIGIMNTSSGSSTAYPVTILLNATSQKLYDGSGASTSIQIAQVSNVLTVPSSAIRTLGQFSSVTVLANGKPVTTRVTVGAVGTDRTQILSGLKAGQTVILANLNEKLPTSSG